MIKYLSPNKERIVSGLIISVSIYFSCLLIFSTNSYLMEHSDVVTINHVSGDSTEVKKSELKPLKSEIVLLSDEEIKYIENALLISNVMQIIVSVLFGYLTAIEPYKSSQPTVNFPR